MKVSAHRLRQIRLAKAKRLGLEVDEDGRVIKRPRTEKTPLRDRIDGELRGDGDTLDALTVMHRHHDPYRIDNPAGHRDGKWFKEQIDQLLGSTATIHLRGLHYVFVTAEVRKPHNGAIYRNTDADYKWLSEHCARHARYLGYVDYDRIVDERNAAPEVFCGNASPVKPRVALSSGGRLWIPQDLEVPDLDFAMPHLTCRTFSPPPQPFRIILIGEKVSLKPILLPIATRVEGELILPTGEMSDTLTANMTGRAAEDGRPAVVLYFSDFDPSGYWMPASVSRKIQAHCDQRYPGLDISVYPVALTYQQVVDLDLPSTPLKEGERRADRWRECWGRSQTEIDALASLQPDVLRQIAADAIRPFYDTTLERRWRHVETMWSIEATRLLRENPKYQEAEAVVAVALERAEAALNELHEANRAIEEAQQIAAKMLNPAMPDPYEIPEPQIAATAPEPLFRSTDDWRCATEKLIAYRKYVGSNLDEAAQ